MRRTMVVLGDQYALLALLWNEAFGLEMRKTGVLVRPDEVRRYLDSMFSAGTGHEKERAALMRAAGALTDAEMRQVWISPYETLSKTLGPAFISISRMCNPPEAETASVVAVDDEAMQRALTKEHPGFRTWRVASVDVTAALPMEHVVRMTHEALKEALQQGQG